MIEPCIWIFNIFDLLHFYTVLFVHKFKNCLTQIRRGEGFWQKILVWLSFVFVFFILKSCFGSWRQAHLKSCPFLDLWRHSCTLIMHLFLFCFLSICINSVYNSMHKSYIDLAKMQFDISEILYKYIFKFIYWNKL